MDPLVLLLCVTGGVLAGVVNTLAGGGSFLILPILLFGGLDAQAASATSRLPIVCQCAAAVTAFSRGQVRMARPALQFAAAGVAGAAAGALVLASMRELVFRHVLAAVLIVAIVPVFLRRPAIDPAATPRGPTAVSLLLFLGVGFYIGLVQAGVGFLILAVLTGAGGYDLVRANAVKVAVVLACTLVALAVFLDRGLVHWPEAIALAVGQMTGGWLGAKLAIRRGTRFVRAIVVAMALLSVVKLLWR